MKRKTWTVDCIWQKMVSTQHSTCYRKMFQFYKSRFKDCSLYIYMHSLLYHSYMCTLLYNCISVSFCSWTSEQIAGTVYIIPLASFYDHPLSPPIRKHNMLLTQIGGRWCHTSSTGKLCCYCGSLVVVGGSYGSTKCSAIHLYQPERKKWTKVGDLPTERRHCFCIALPNGKLLVAAWGKWEFLPVY